MRKLFAGGLIAGLFTVGIAAQDPSTVKPGAEQKNLARFAGNWKMEGTMEPSPLGPGGKMSGTERCRMFEGGWHLVCDSTGTSPMGPITGHAIMTYDRNAKQYRYFAVNNMADAELATGTLSGNTWTWNSTMDQGGQKLQSRFTIVELPGAVHSFKWEMSMDGKSWKAIMQGTSTKAGS